MVMRLIVKVLGTILVLLMVAGFLNGLAGGNDPKTKVKRVIPIGKMQLEIPDDTPHNVFAVTRVALKKVGYEAWYRNCIVGQAERLLTLKEAKELAHDPEGQLSVILKAQPNCEKPGRNLLDPTATSIQLGFVKEQTAVSLGLLLAKQGLGFHKRMCIANQVRYASDDQALTLLNGPPAAQEGLMIRLAGRCR